MHRHAPLSIEAIVNGWAFKGIFDKDKLTFTCDIRELPPNITNDDDFIINRHIYRSFDINDDYPSVIFHLYEP